MAVNIKVGEILTAKLVRRGTKDDKPWELIAVAAEGKDKKQITVWTENAPSDVKEGQEFIVQSISSIKYGARKIKDVWHDDVSCNAVVKSVVRQPVVTGLSIPMDGFSEIDDDGELPF